MPINEYMLLEVQNISVFYLIEKGKTLLNSCLLSKASLLVPITDCKEEKTSRINFKSPQTLKFLDSL